MQAVAGRFRYTAVWLLAEMSLIGLSVSLWADETIRPLTLAFMQHVNADPQGTSAFTFERSAYDQELNSLPIGIFDSGIGGLTVMEAILTLDAFDNDTLRPGADGRPDFQNEQFVYLGDQANMPYGNYVTLGQDDYLRELILKDAVFLLGRRYWKSAAAEHPSFDKPPIKAIVIACNTATAFGLQQIRAMIDAWNIPIFVVGVVEAGARGVNESIRSTDDRHTVAVLATVGTCNSGAYPQAIGRATGLAGKRVPRILQQGSVGLAGAIEGDPAFIAENTDESQTDGSRPEVNYLGPGPDNSAAPLDLKLRSAYGFEPAGILGDPTIPESLRLNSIRNYVRYEVTMLVENYRQSGGTEAIDTVVLGCTHFPLVRDEILSAFARLRNLSTGSEPSFPYRSLIADSITIIDPAALTAKDLFRSLATAGLRCAEGTAPDGRHDLFFISVPSPVTPGIRLTADGRLDPEYRYGRATGEWTLEDTRFVPLRLDMLSELSVNLIRDRLPEVWRRIIQER